MKTKFIYVVLMAFIFGKPDDPFCNRMKTNKERNSVLPPSR